MKPDKLAALVLPGDRYYDRETHLWVEARPGGPARCGFDPVGAETCGDVVAVSFEPIGARVVRGGAFGSLEAAKFVGPLLAPLSGVIRGHNRAVLEDPALLNQDPLLHWLVEIVPDRAEEELEGLIHGDEEVRAWYRDEIDKYRREGLLAE